MDERRRSHMVMLVSITYIIYGGLIIDALFNRLPTITTYLFQIMLLTMAVFVITCNGDPDPIKEKRVQWVLAFGSTIIAAAIIMRVRYGCGCQPPSSFDFVYAVFAAVSEELWFRKAFIDLSRRINKKYATEAAVIIGTLVWTLLHQHASDPAALLLIFLLGVSFAILYIYTRDVLPLIFIHAIYNLIILL